MNAPFDYNAIPDWAVRHELDRTPHNKPIAPGIRCILAKADRPIVTTSGGILMPNGYYQCVVFDDGDTLYVRPWDLTEVAL